MSQKTKVNLNVPIYARKLKKADIHLRREERNNWGRFLDNHYNEKLHAKPFGVAMKAPDTSYKYSKSGLSHHYKTIKILEKLSVEEQSKREGQVRKFNEVENIKADDLYIFIEYWSNSEKTQVSTRHIQEKYEVFAKRFRQGILEKFPFIKVYLKSDSEDEKVVKYTLSNELNANIIEDQRTTVRIGAFEITLARKFRNIVKTEVLFSKLKTKLWPNMPLLLQKISTYLPKTNLVVTLFNPDDANDKEGMDEIKVNLKLSFKDSKANEDLKNDVNKIHSGKINQALEQREKLIKKRSDTNRMRYGSIVNHSQRNDPNRLSARSVQRPVTAGTRFSASFHQSIMSLVKENNEYRQQSGMRKFSSVSRRSFRPQTATNIKNKNLRTIENRTVKSSYSISSLGINPKRKKKKGKKIKDIEFTLQVNENNEIHFENIPKAVYTIESLENPFFQKSTRSVNLMQEGDNGGESKIYLPVERQVTSCTSLYFVKTKDNSEEVQEEEIEYFDELRVRAWLLEKPKAPYGQEPEEGSDDGNETEYEEEFFHDEATGCYRASLVPGKYMILADGEGLAQFSETVEITEGDMKKEIILKKKEKKLFLFCVRDGRTGENLNSTLVKFKKKTSRSVKECVTDDQGICAVSIEDFGTYFVEADKKGYITSRMEFQYTKMNQEINQLTLLMIPVEAPIKQQDEGEGQLPTVKLRMVLFADHTHESGPPMIKFKSRSSEEGGEDKEETLTPDNEVYEENFSLSLKRAGDTNWYYGEIETSRDDWVRIYYPIANLKAPGYDEVDQFSLWNVKIPQARFILYSDNRELGKVSPSYSEDYHPIWDIGLLNPAQKKFMQTNFFVREDEYLTRKSMLRPYFKYIKYLNNQNEYYNFSMIFGFNEGTFKFDDYHIKPIDFYSRMKELDVEWVNPELEGEKHEEARMDFEHFIHYMSTCMTNVLGEIPLKKVQEKFGPHLNMNPKK